MVAVLSDAMQAMVDEILTDSTSNIMKIDAKLTSPNNSEYEVILKKVDALDIVQDFEGAYMDFIEIDFELSIEEYKLTLENYQDLRCTVIITTTDDEDDMNDEILATYEHKIIFKNKVDLFKDISEADLIPTEKSGLTEEHISNRIPVTAQLIDPKTYELRKRQLSFILKDATVEDALHFIASTLGIKNVYIVEPDNTRTYNNFIIPPMMNFSNVFLYIQEHYGVYNKGFTWYYTDEVLSIYPSYAVDNFSPYTVHIYKVSQGHVSGAPSYHIYKDDDIHLISNTDSSNESNIDKGVENVGNAYIVQEGEDIIDTWRIMSEDGFDIPTTGVEVIGVETEDGMSEDPHHPQFKFSSSNKQVHMSELAKSNVSPIEVGWQYAIPYKILPGYQLKYHYDGKNGEYSIDDIIASSVMYNIRPNSRLDDRLYGCSCTVRCWES